MLHSPAPRRGLRRPDAAAYIGVGTSKFDQLVAEGRMPKPKHIDGCVIWDVKELDLAFDLATDQPSEDEEEGSWEGV